MMRRRLLALALAWLVSTFGNIQADDDPKDKPRGDGDRLNNFFAKLDKNSDGVVTEDEVGEDAKPLFERLLRLGDKNKDGKLTKEELAAGLKEGAKRPEGAPGGDRPAFDPMAIFNRFDKNGDGKISKDEIPERGAEFIERFDANKDGEITKEEFKAGVAKTRPTGDAPRPAAAGDGMLFRALDTNGDGKISAEEMSRAGETLKKLDRNGDGAISREELGGAGDTPERGELSERIKAGGLLERLKQADKNGDGKISKDEAPEGLKERFDRLDANSDGVLDQDELRKGFDALRDKVKQRKDE